MRRVLVWTLAVTVGCTVALSGCSKEYRRAADDPEIDYYAMSLRFDRRDINKLYEEVRGELISSAIVEEWNRGAGEGQKPTVALFPMKNNTSEHIRSQLETLLSKFETDLVQQTSANVISRERQKELIAEIKEKQGSGAYDQDRVPDFGRQLGADYVLTGKVRDVAERTDGERRVQYFLFVQVLDVETGTIEFQHEASVTKALM